MAALVVAIEQFVQAAAQWPHLQTTRGCRAQKLSLAKASQLGFARLNQKPSGRTQGATASAICFCYSLRFKSRFKSGR